MDTYVKCGDGFKPKMSDHTHCSTYRDLTVVECRVLNHYIPQESQESVKLGPFWKLGYETEELQLMHHVMEPLQDHNSIKYPKKCTNYILRCNLVKVP